MAEEPENTQWAEGLAMAVVYNQARTGPRAPVVAKLVAKFPDNGTLASLHAAALAQDADLRGAYRELERARKLGTDPAKIIRPENVTYIDEEGSPWALRNLPITFGWIMAWFAGFYAVIMLLMAGVGVVLALQTRGDRALELIGEGPDALVQEGQVVRSRSESLLARLYAAALFVGLLLFYAAVPFIIAGLLALTGLLLYVIFMLPRIPVKLILIIVLVGGGAAFAVIKSLFTRPSK